MNNSFLENQISKYQRYILKGSFFRITTISLVDIFQSLFA